MLVQQNTPSTTVTAKDIPASLLSQLNIGQRLEAVAITSALANEIIKLKVAESLIDVKTAVALQKGQTINLELIKAEDGKLQLKLIPAENNQTTKQTVASEAAQLSTKLTVNADKLLAAPTLKVGQHYVLEVLKVLANNRLLVDATFLPDKSPQKAGAAIPLPTQAIKNDTASLQQMTVSKPMSMPNMQQAVNLDKSMVSSQLTTNTASLLVNAERASPILQTTATPVVQYQSQKMEIDLSRVGINVKLGEKLAMQVMQTNPLAIKVMPERVLSPKQQVLTEQIKRLLPLQPELQNSMTNLAKSHQNNELPAPITRSVQQLFQHVLDKTAVNQPQQFKQAVENSGSFLERQLLQRPELIQQDFKANIERVIGNLKQAITAHENNRSPGQQLSRISLENLPPPVKNALIAISESPENLTKIPTQVKSALAKLGVTPAQLLMSVLSGQAREVPASSANQSAVLANQVVNTPIPQKPEQQAVIQSRIAAVEVAMLRELLKEAETTHARIQLNQLTMLKDPDSPTSPNVWLFDVPIKDKERLDMLQIKVEQHKHNTEELEGDIWEVELRLDTQELGPLQAQISLHEQDVKVLLKAQKPETVDLLEQGLPDLQAKLADLGASVSHISCTCGKIEPVSNTANYFTGSDGFVDISV